MEAQPHDSDVKALLRLCVAWNIPMACDRATADFIMTSPFMHNEYEAAQPDYTGYLNRDVKDDEEYIQLRPWQKQDAQVLAAIANNRNIWNNVRDQLPNLIQ
jgi:hypothetical protein